MRVVKNNGYYELKLKKDNEWKTIFIGSEEQCFKEIQNVKLGWLDQVEIEFQNKVQGAILMELVKTMLVEHRVKYNQEVRKFKKKFEELKKANPELKNEEVYKSSLWTRRVREQGRAIEILENI